MTLWQVWDYEREVVVLETTDRREADEVVALLCEAPYEVRDAARDD